MESILFDDDLTTNRSSISAATTDSTQAEDNEAAATPTPSCGKCKNPLGPSIDKQITTGKFWKNCKRCRDKYTASRKNAKNLTPNVLTPEASSKPKAAPIKRRRTEAHDREDVISSSVSDVDIFFDAENLQNPTEEAIHDLVAPFISAYETSVEDIATGKEKDSMDIDQEEEKSRTCSVCDDTFPVKDFPSLIACSHEANVCQECFLRWLDQRMASTTWEQIECPSSTCTNAISHDDVKMYAPVDTFTRFDELSMRSFLSNDPSFFHCPAEGCTSGQIYDTTSAGNIFRCNVCGFRVCTHHATHVPFHENETCTQFDERIARERAEKADEERRKREEDAASLEVIGKSSVECPGCGVNISKTMGCDHMTCRRVGCRFEFCYVCRAPYQGAEGIWRVGNTAHTENCLYHPNKLPLYRGDLQGLV